MDLEYLQVAIDCKIDDFENALESAQKGLGRLSDYAKTAGESLTKYVTAPLALLAGASLKTAGDIDALERGFKAIYKGAGDVGAELKKTYEIAKLPGLGLKEAVQGSVRLQAVGFSAEEAGKALRSFGNAVALTGGGKSELDRILVQLTQVASSTKVLTADLRPIISTAPIVGEALQKMYGTIDAEQISAKLQTVGKTNKEFVADLVAELAKLPQTTAGLNNSFENFGDSITKSLAKVGSAINRALNVEGVLGKLADGIESLAESFGNLSPGTQTFILGVAGAAAAVGPLLLAISAVGAAIPYVTAGFAAFGITSVAALAPILPVAAAVGVAALLIYDHWSDIVNYFENEGGKVFADTAKSVQNAVAAIANAFSKLGGTTKGNLGDLIAATGIFKALFEEINTGIASIADTVANTVNFVTDLFSGQFAKALQDAGKNVESLSRPLRALLGFKPERGSTIGQFFAKDFQAARAAAEAESKALADALTGGNIEAAVKSQLVTLDSLKAKLEELKKLHGTEEVGTIQFANTKQQIIDLEALIKKYEDTGKAAKKAADEINKAFAEVAAKLKGITIRVDLGTESQYDAVIEKVKVLKDGIEDVTNKGVAGNSPRLLGLRNQLVAAQADLQKLLNSFKFKPVAIDINFDLDTDEIARIQKDLNKATLTAKIQFQLDGDKAKLAKALADAQEQATQALATAQVSPSNPKAQAIAGDVKPLQIQAEQLQSLQEYEASLAEISDTSAVLGSSFNAAGARVSVLSQRMVELARTQREAQEGIKRTTAQINEIASSQSLDPAVIDANTTKLQALTAQLEKYRAAAKAAGVASVEVSAGLTAAKRAADWSDVQNTITSSLENLVAQSASIIGEGIGSLITGAASGKDALNSLFSGVLGAIGGFLQQIGAALIAYGVAMDAFKKAFTNPYLAIAAGAAVVVLGGILSGIASSGFKSASGGGSSPASSAASTASTSSQASANKINIQVTFAPVELRAEGPHLRGVMAVDKQRLTNLR